MMERTFCKYCKEVLVVKKEQELEYHISCQNEVDNNTITIYPDHLEIINKIKSILSMHVFYYTNE